MKNSTITKDVEKVLDKFPKLISEKKRRAKERKAFLQRTFGAVIKLLKTRN